MSEWIKFDENMSFEDLKSINIDNQVLAYQGGRYYNAWLVFDEYEGGWLWMDDNDSEPNPSHYTKLPGAPSA